MTEIEPTLQLAAGTSEAGIAFGGRGSLANLITPAVARHRRFDTGDVSRAIRAIHPHATDGDVHETVRLMGIARDVASS